MVASNGRTRTEARFPELGIVPHVAGGLRRFTTTSATTTITTITIAMTTQTHHAIEELPPPPPLVDVNVIVWPTGPPRTVRVPDPDAEL